MSRITARIPTASLRASSTRSSTPTSCQAARNRAANLQRLQSACRRAHVEIVYAAVENLTRDGRDRSLDYKISGIDVPRGSWEAQVLEEIASAEDEMIFRKTSSSVFVSTNIDYVLRNLGVRSLIVAGMMTDQCIESAVRDACDLGYLVTLVTEACLTDSAERHEQSLIGIRGYCCQRTTGELLAEIEHL
jgi:ureidoacrylate peracid hydrolase